MTIARQSFRHDSLIFSYLDTAGSGRPLIALHAHLMEAATFAPLAAALAPDWRLIALDQRGHGHSSHAPSYTRTDYLGDIEALFHHLGLSHAVLLGASLGGVNAYQFAARHAEKVSALIVEDIGAIVSDDISFILPWAGIYPTREDLVHKIGARFAPYFADSFRQTESGWTLAFDPHQMVASQKQLVGDHWQDWLANTCPALLLRGRESRVTNPDQLERMAEQRPNTTLVTLEGGHALHVDNPIGFISAVRAFLDTL